MMRKKCKSIGCYESACCHDGHCLKHTRNVKKKKGYSCRTYPKTTELHLGVELECFGGGEECHKGMLAQRITPCSDGSLPAYGCEYKWCMPAAKTISDAPNFCEHLVRIGARVNKKCGLHVHLDARGLSPERIKEFVMWMGRCEAWWFTLVPESRRTNGYVRRTGGGFLRNHCAWINQTNYSTVEIRIHGGTINPYKVAGWLTAMSDLLTLLHSGKALPEIVLDANLKVDSAWLRDVFPSAEAREYLVARQNNNGSLESYTEAESCAD